MAGLQLLKGVLHCLAHTRLKTLLSSDETTLQQFMTTMTGICELTRPDALLHIEYGTHDVVDDNALTNRRRQWREFKNLPNDTAVECVTSICQILGRSNAADILFAYAMDEFVRNTIDCNNVLVLMQLLLNGGGWGEAHRLHACLTELQRSVHWHLDEQATRTTEMKMAEVLLCIYILFCKLNAFPFLVWTK